MQKLIYLSLVFLWGCSTFNTSNGNRYPASVAKASVVPDSENAANCFMAVIKGNDAGDPTYQHMLGLIKFKPAAGRAVGNYLNLQDGQDPVPFLQSLMAADPLGAAGHPPYERTDKTCAAVQPFAAELNLMFSSGSLFAAEDVGEDLNKLCLEQPKLPRCVEAKRSQLILYPDECWGRTDLQKCMQEYEARELEPNEFPKECWGKTDLQKCKQEYEARQQGGEAAQPASGVAK